MVTLVKLAVLGLRAIYFLFKLFLKPRRKITFLSRQDDKPSVDFILTTAALKKGDFDGEVKVLCKKIAPSLFGKVTYAFYILVQMYHIATSKVIVTDGYSIAVCVLKHKPEQKIVQLWHALNIVKKFGHMALDKPWGHKSSTAKALCMHRGYTHFVACSPHSAQVLAKCFNMPEDKAVLLPLPRIEYILQAPQKTEQIKQTYPKIFEKPILVYAPTFRGERVDLSWIGDNVDLDKYNVVVKLHPADKMGLDTNVDKRVLCDNRFSSFDWTKVCDGLITDYSGMGFEAMLLGKKVYYYLYDYKEYSQNNGLNLDLFSESIAPYVTEYAEKLGALLQEEYDFSLSEQFVRKYLSVGTENCASRLAQFIESLV